MGGESTIFDFQGNKLLEGATNTDARHSTFNHPSGHLYIFNVDANMVIVTRNTTIVKGTLSRMPLRERRRGNVIYEAIVRGTIVICCAVIVYALQVVLR